MASGPHGEWELVVVAEPGYALRSRRDGITSVSGADNGAEVPDLSVFYRVDAPPKHAPKKNLLSFDWCAQM